MSTAYADLAGASSVSHADWISFAAPASRPQIRLIREPVRLFDDPIEDYPSARFVRYEGDDPVI